MGLPEDTYVDADPGQTAALDSRGLEFVYFQGRVLLKISGIYSAAYNTDQLTQNERALRTFQEVIVPVLRLIINQIPQKIDFDGIGFEIVHHTRQANKNYEYEGKEIFVVVFNKNDAFAYLNVNRDEERQAILNRSEIFVDAKEFRLALKDRDSLNLEARGG